MTAYFFGSGTIIAKRVGVANAQPAFLGTMQDFEFDIDQTIKELMGQYKVPVAIAAGQTKITMKAKFARVQANTINSLMLDQSLSPSSGINLAVAENGAIPNTTTSTTVVVSNATSFTTDLGVFYASNGTQLVPGTSASAAGTYSVAAGTYSFNASDKGLLVQIYYEYAVTNMQSIAWNNQLMGQQPTFQLDAQEQFNYLGSQKTMVLKLNACVSSKLTFPFKNTDFMISEMDIMAFADASNSIGTIAISE